MSRWFFITFLIILLLLFAIPKGNKNEVINTDVNKDENINPAGMEVVVDSSLTTEEALKQNPNMIAPGEILERQRLINVTYYSFDDKLHNGQIVVDSDLAKDVQVAFDLLKNEKFPIASVIPLSDSRFQWDDDLSMNANNSSGFNYRFIAGTKQLSNHAYGRAIDINPIMNPYVFASGSVIPENATYDPAIPGTIVENSTIVKFLTERGWVWGGNWTDNKDYQHFEKPQ